MIICDNLSISYDGRVAAKDINFTLNEGDYLCVVGENGSGKSTLMKGLLGLVKPSAGKIEHNGRGRIGYMPQQTAIQKDFPASVHEVVLSGRLNRRGVLPFYSKSDKQIAADNMQRLEIDNLCKKSYRDLSGGQQQRVLLARALCAADKLLLLDEPAAGLDLKITSSLYSLLNKLNAERGVTIVMISHDIQSAVSCGNKILHLQTRQLFFGETSEYVKTGLYAAISGKERANA